MSPVCRIFSYNVVLTKEQEVSIYHLQFTDWVGEFTDDDEALYLAQTWKMFYIYGIWGGGLAPLVSPFCGLFSVEILEKRPSWCQSLVY